MPRPVQGERSPGGQPFRLLLAVTLLVLVALAVLLIGLRYFNVDEVAVPDLRGEDLEVAYYLLRGMDLDARAYAQHSLDVPVNSVISQSPEAGTLVRRGRSISLNVNMPEGDISVPDLTGRDYREALLLLERSGLVADEVQHVPSDQAVGRIVSQQPPPGTVLNTGDNVSLSVSRGFQAERRTLPSVVGLAIDEARARLQEAGFNNIETVVTEVSRAGSSTVQAQTPEPGQEMLDNLPVTLYYTLADARVVSVPNLNGLSEAAAQSRLRQIGLEPAWVSYENNESRPAGVTDWQPRGWTLRGSPVRITVNRVPSTASTSAAEPATPAATTTTTPLGETPASSSPPGQPETAAPGSRRIPIDYSVPSELADRVWSFSIVVIDDQGRRTVHEEDVRPGNRIQTTITVHGEADVEFYLDDGWVLGWKPQ